MERAVFACGTIVVAALAMQAARILSVPGALGYNDASRWVTVGALGDQGTYVIGHRRVQADGSFKDEGALVPVDIVLHPETNEFYSSKPPLLSTLIAGEYLAIKKLAGIEFKTHATLLVRVILMTVNWIPLALYLAVLAALLLRDAKPRGTDDAVAIGDAVGAGDSRRTASAAVEPGARDRGLERAAIATVAIGCFGTFVTTFASVLTNHLPSAVGCVLALPCFARVWASKPAPAIAWIGAGFFAGWTASHEVPALCFPAALGVLAFQRDRARTLVWFLPAALIPLGAFWLTNWIALGDPFSFYFRDSDRWFKYAGSYWENPVGVDIGESSFTAYFFHFLAGHHGVFSLAPIFLLAPLGLARAFGPRARSPARVAIAALAFISLCWICRHLSRTAELPLPVALLPAGLAALAALLLPLGWWRDPTANPRAPIARVTLFSTLVVFAFYLVNTSNYGGVSAGPRWLIWLMPLWLLAIHEVLAELLDTRRGLIAAALLAAISIFSANYPGLNPWQHPWIYALTRG